MHTLILPVLEQALVFLGSCLALLVMPVALHTVLERRGPKQARVVPGEKGGRRGPDTQAQPLLPTFPPRGPSGGGGRLALGRPWRAGESSVAITADKRGKAVTKGYVWLFPSTDGALRPQRKSGADQGAGPGPRATLCPWLSQLPLSLSLTAEKQHVHQADHRGEWGFVNIVFS